MKRRIGRITIVTFIILSLLLPSVIQRSTADTQSGFILASPGKDGKWGTNDDIFATEKSDIFK